MAEIERYNGGIEYANSGDIFVDAKTIIDSSQRAAHGAINTFLVVRNWLLGRRIVEEELGNSTRAELYGRKVVPKLAKELTKEYGRAIRVRACIST